MNLKYIKSLLEQITPGEWEIDYADYWTEKKEKYDAGELSKFDKWDSHDDESLAEEQKEMEIVIAGIKGVMEYHECGSHLIEINKPNREFISKSPEIVRFLLNIIDTKLL